MRIYQYEKRLDCHALGQEIKRRRKAKGWTQEHLAQLVDLTPRSIMYIENRGQHTSLNAFYKLVTLFDISVDEFFYPDKLGGESERRKRIDRMLNDMDEKELIIIEGAAEGIRKATRPPFFAPCMGERTKRQAIRVWPHSEIFAGPWARKNACWGASPNPALWDTVNCAPSSRQ